MYSYVMLVLNMRVNPKKCVAESSSSVDGVYGASSKKAAPKRETSKNTTLRSASKTAPVEIKKPVPPTEEIVFETPVFEPVTVTTLTEEERKYVKMYEKMHKKEIDVSQYKVKTYIAQTKEQAKEAKEELRAAKKAERVQKTEPIQEPVQPVNPEEITSETIISANLPEEVKKTNWFKRLFEKIKEFFKKLFKRKKKENNERDSEDIDS